MDMIKSYLQKWNTQKNAFSKVQSAYLALAVMLFLLAAVISLVNPNLGQSIIFFSLMAFLVFVGNAVIWALLQTFVVSGLEEAKLNTAKLPVKTRKK